MREFLGSHVAGKLLDWAVGQGVLVFAGSEQEQATRRIFEEATIEALTEACDESALSSDEESVSALAEHLASALSEPSVAAVLLRAANTNGVVDADTLVERMKRSGFDAEFVPFEMEAFLAAVVSRLSEGIGREVRTKGLTEAAVSDKLDELLARTERLTAAESNERRDILPPPPELVLGREDELRRVKRTLTVGSKEALPGSGGTLRILKFLSHPGRL